MSADNGIYILRTRDQYRVAEERAIDRIFYDPEGLELAGGTLNPAVAVEVWGNSRAVRDGDAALEIAVRMLERLPGCEYGIRVFDYPKEWGEICRDAKKREFRRNISAQH